MVSPVVSGFAIWIPKGVRKTMTLIMTLDETPLRLFGLVLMIVGLVVAWWAVG